MAWLAPCNRRLSVARGGNEAFVQFPMEAVRVYRDPFAESGPPVSGRDARGFNVGPGCSDDPANPLPGCNDSPSVPAGDSSGTCASGITVDRQTTSCGLAENVYSSYTEDGPVTAVDPTSGEDYAFTCKTAGPGTTEETICLGRAGPSPLYVRWHP